MRLIDADELKKAFIDEWNYEADYTIFRQVENIIDNAPTVEPEITDEDLRACMAESHRLGYELAETKFKKPQGQWKVRTADDGLIYYQCTVCWKNNFFEDFPFCPYCGARVKTGRLRKGNDNGKKL